MRRKEGRTIGLYFKVSPEEMALIEKKMEQAGTKNKRAYLRKMAVPRMWRLCAKAMRRHRRGFWNCCGNLQACKDMRAQGITSLRPLFLIWR